MTLLLLLLACGSDKEGDTAVQASDGGASTSVDADGDGWSLADGDCDDDDAAVHPDATELCNQVDDDCDDRVDEGLEHFTWYADGDGDGYGLVDTATSACQAPAEHWVLLGTDCDDGDASIHPDATELCDDIDQDCDDEIDEGLPQQDWWVDSDDDGWGNSHRNLEDCSQPDGTVDREGDCDDTDPTVFPGADEDWTDDTDSDCDGEVEQAAPVVLTGAEGVEEVHLLLPADRAVRVISVASEGAVEVEVDVAQPTVLVLVGEVEWSVVDLQGTVEEVLELDSEGVAELDDPRIYDQWLAVEEAHGEVASWHGVAAASSLRLEEVADWPDRHGWPDCDGPVEPEDIAEPDLDAVQAMCPDLGDSDPSGTVCLTATDTSIVAFDLAGASCTVAPLEEAPAGNSLLWTGRELLLTDGPYGSLARIDLPSGRRDRAWLWPEALLTYDDGALLVPGEEQSELDHGIVYLYEGWGALSCGDGANLTDVWADDLAVSTLSGVDAWWWESGEELLRWDLDRELGSAVEVTDLAEVSGLDLLPDGTLGLLVDGELWVVDGNSGVVLESVEVGVSGQGLSCAGG